VLCLHLFIVYVALCNVYNKISLILSLRDLNFCGRLSFVVLCSVLFSLFFLRIKCMFFSMGLCLK